MKTCNSCFSKFQGLGYKCLHCLTYSDFEERRKEEARAQEDNRAYQEQMIRQENLRHAQELIEQRRENARIAAQQERDEMNQNFANAKTAETNIKTEDAFDYGKNYLAIDYKIMHFIEDSWKPLKNSNFKHLLRTSKNSIMNLVKHSH
jgi:hypothetical protein